MIKDSTKAEIAGTANDIYNLLTVLSSPQAAAQAIGLAHLRLIENASIAATEETVRAMLAEMTENIVENWLHRQQHHSRFDPEGGIPGRA